MVALTEAIPKESSHFQSHLCPNLSTYNLALKAHVLAGVGLAWQCNWCSLPLLLRSVSNPCTQPLWDLQRRPIHMIASSDPLRGHIYRKHAIPLSPTATTRPLCPWDATRSQPQNHKCTSGVVGDAHSHSLARLFSPVHHHHHLNTYWIYWIHTEYWILSMQFIENCSTAFNGWASQNAWPWFSCAWDVSVHSWKFNPRPTPHHPSDPCLHSYHVCRYIRRHSNDPKPKQDPILVLGSINWSSGAKFT